MIVFESLYDRDDESLLEPFHLLASLDYSFYVLSYDSPAQTLTLAPLDARARLVHPVPINVLACHSSRVAHLQHLSANGDASPQSPISTNFE